MAALTDSEIGAIREWLDGEYPRMIEKLAHLTEINSHTTHRNGLETLAERLGLEMTEAGLEVHSAPGGSFTHVTGTGIRETLSGDHLHGRRKGSGMRFLLLGHYDTVYPPDYGFDRFERLSRDEAAGPGVTDMKGGLVILLTAVRGMRELGFSEPGIEVILNSDEEVGSPTSRSLIVEHALESDAVFVFEPVLGKNLFADERGGAARLAVSAVGKAAHAGRNPDEGANAIAALADAVLRLQKLARPDRGFRISTGIFHGGAARNQVPEHAFCDIDIRYERQEDLDRFENEAKGILAAPSVPGTELTAASFLSRPPKPAAAALTDYLRRIHRSVLGDGELRFVSSGGVTDGNLTGALKIPTIDTMGALGSGIHSRAEKIFLPSLREQTLLTIATLAALSRERPVLR